MKWVHAACAVIVLLSIGILYNRSAPILSRDYHLPVIQTLYLDTSLSEEDKLAVIGAALEWQIATDGWVRYHIVILPNHEVLTEVRPVIIISVSPYFPEVIALDTEKDTTHLGYYNRHKMITYIALVGDRLTDDNRKIVAMHELGHALGLGHNEGDDGMNTLMYPNVELEADHITDYDLHKLCQLYGCNANQLHHQ